MATIRLGLALVVMGIALAGGFAQEARKDSADSLPEGALKRLGSLRWRHGEPITFLAQPPDGKTLITAGQDSVLRLWDRSTGTEIRRFALPVDANTKRFMPFNFYMHGLTRAGMSKDGKMLAVALPSNVVQLWDVETGAPLRQIKSPANGVGAVAFTPDGKTVAIRGVNDRTCFLHEAATGIEIRRLKPAPQAGNGGNVFGGAGDGTNIAISPNGKFIALPDLEIVNQRVVGSVTLFEISTGKVIRRIETQMNGIAAIAFSPDSKLLVFNTHNAIHVWDAELNKEIRQIQAFFGVNLMVFAPDGKTLAVKGRDQAVRLYDPANGKLVRTIGEPPGQKGLNVGFVANPNGAITTDVVFSADSQSLVVGGQQVPRFFDAGTGKEEALPSGGHRGAVSALMATPDGKTLISCGAEGSLFVWDIGRGIEIRQFPEPAGTSAVRFSPDGKLVAFGTNDGIVHLLASADGKQKRQFKAHQGTIATVAFSADGKMLATRGSYDGLLHIYDVDKGAEIRTITYQDIKAGNGGVVIVRTSNVQGDGNPLAFSPDGKTLAAFIAPQQVQNQGFPQMQPVANSVRLFDVGTGKEIRQIPMPADRAIHQLAYSPDGRLLISENLDKTVSVWEVASGLERSRLGTAVAAPPQVTTMAFVVINGIARSGPPTAPVGATIAIARDGSLIAAPGANNTIKVFDASLGKEVGSFRGHDGAIASLVFAADGKTLVSGGNDTTILVWDLARLKREPRPQVAELQPKDADTLWADLISADAGKAGKTVQTLIARSNASVAVLKERVQPAVPADPKKVEQWLRDLDSSVFKTRVVALKELEKLGELAIPELQKWSASQSSLEARRRAETLLEKLTGQNLTPEQIRVVRVIEVLDRIGTAEAKQVLERLAGGAPGSITTREAETSLQRLAASKN